MADLINKNDISFRCSYGGECMAEIEDCKICVHYVCDYEDVQNVAVIAEQEIRSKAIDEFAEKIQWEYLNSCGLKQREIDFLVAVSSMVAEQMKAGGKYE